MSVEYGKELDLAIAAARQAGIVVRDLYDRSGARQYTKDDGSPVTDADLASDKLIRAALGRYFPDDAILTEEGADDQARLEAKRVWIVDPIDGTEQFVAGTGEFDILIALAVDGAPVAGVALQPTTGKLLAGAVGCGAWIEEDGVRRPLAFKPVPVETGPRIVTSKWFGSPQSLPVLRRVAERLGSPEPVVNQVGVYVRHFVDPVLDGEVLIGMSMKPGGGIGWEWDLAASDAIVNIAGGRYTKLDGRRFTYNNPHPRNQGGFVLSPDPETHARVLAALAPELNETNNPL